MLLHVKLNLFVNMYLHEGVQRVTYVAVFSELTASALNVYAPFRGHIL